MSLKSAEIMKLLWSKFKERKVLLISALLFGIIVILIAATTSHADQDSTSISADADQIRLDSEDHTFIITASSDSDIISQWRANLSTNASDILINKLQEIRELSPFGTGVHESQNFSDAPSKICYTEECLDAALNFLKIGNFSVDPCNDFYEFSCGQWETKNPDPNANDRQAWAPLHALSEKSTEIIRQILQAPVETLDWKPLKQAKDFYASCLDTPTKEKKGTLPLLTVLNSYGGWPSATPNWNFKKFNVNTAIADSNRLFFNPIMISLRVIEEETNGLENTFEKYIEVTKPDTFFLDNIHLLNPDEYPLIIDAYKAYYVSVAKVLAKATGASVTDEDLTSQVQDVIEFETRLVRSSESFSKSIDIDETGHIKWKYAGLKLDSETMISQLFSSTGVSVGTKENIYRIDFEYQRYLAAILASTEIRTVANYFCWRVAAALVPYTTEALIDLAYEFKWVTVAVKPAVRNTLCLDGTLNQFRNAVESKFVQNVLAPNTKAGVTKMVENIRAAFQQNLEAASWMEEGTRKEAIKKLKAMREFIGYPDWILNQTQLEQKYEGLVLVTGDFFGSRLNYLSWIANKNLKTLRSNPLISNVNNHNDGWEFPLSTANAYNNVVENSITIPAAIMQPPFYRNKGPKSLNYGGVGTIIGHELTHGFGFQGRWYDSNGQVTNWWTNNTWNNFWDKAFCFIRLYIESRNEIRSLAATLISGNEDVADNVGLRQAFFGYRKWIQERNGGKPEPRLPGLELYSPEQIFFLRYANNWCESSSEQNRGSELNVDYHTEGRLRVMIPLQNFDEFGLQWRCPAGSPMRPAVDQTCMLWK